MKFRLLAWIIIAAAFLGMALSNYISIYLQVGTWVAGFTSFYWWIYILVVLALGLATCIRPHLNNLFGLVSIPLVLTMLVKSLCTIGLQYYLELSIHTLMHAVLGLGLSGLFFVFYYLANRNFRTVSYVFSLLILGVTPVAFEFTQQMLPQP